MSSEMGGEKWLHRSDQRRFYYNFANFTIKKNFILEHSVFSGLIKTESVVYWTESNEKAWIFPGRWLWTLEISVFTIAEEGKIQCGPTPKGKIWNVWICGSRCLKIHSLVPFNNTSKFSKEIFSEFVCFWKIGIFLQFRQNYSDVGCQSMSYL